MQLVNNKNGIPVSSSFEVITNLPIDTRLVVDTIEERNKIYNAYDGLIVYIKDTQQYFRYNESKDLWEQAMTSMISVTGYPSSDIGYIGDWALSDVGSLYHKEVSVSGTAQWVPKAVMGGGGSGGGSVNIGTKYASIDAMNADINNAEVGTIAIIDSGVGDPDNGKLFKMIESNGIYGWTQLGNLSGPAGENGTNGKDGVSSTIRINNITTLEPGSEATVENVGDDTNLILNIGIPRGTPGIDGAKGDKGDTGLQGIEGPKGPAGTIQINSIKAISFGEEPKINNIGTAESAILDIELPAGPQGIQGEPSMVNNKTPVEGNISLTLDDIPDGENNKLIPEVDYF